MKKHEADRLIAVIRELATEESTAPARGLAGKMIEKASAERLPSEEALRADIAGRSTIDAAQLERIYAEVKRRLLDELPSDPIFLQLLATQSEIIVEIQPRTVTIDGGSLRGRVARLIADGFFESAKRQGECRTEMERTGGQVNSGNLSTLFSEFVKDGFLERTAGDRFIKRTGLKVSQKVITAI